MARRTLNSFVLPGECKASCFMIEAPLLHLPRFSRVTCTALEPDFAVRGFLCNRNT